MNTDYIIDDIRVLLKEFSWCKMVDFDFHTFNQAEVTVIVLGGIPMTHHLQLNDWIEGRNN